MHRLGCFPDSTTVHARQCANAVDKPDVMGWHDAREHPELLELGKDYVLQDHMFEPNFGSSIPSHVAMVSSWTAKCPDPRDVTTCRPDLVNPHSPTKDHPDIPPYAWTDVTWLAHKHHVTGGTTSSPAPRPTARAAATRCASRPSARRGRRSCGTRSPGSRPYTRTASWGTSRP